MSGNDQRPGPADDLPQPGPSPSFLRREKAILAIVLIQAGLVMALNLHCPEVWPRDDAVTYFTQGLMLRLGLFPPDPARPLLYPLLLAGLMKMLGMNIFLIRMAQGLTICITTVLLYRLARMAAGKRTAIIACIIFAAFPDSLFHAVRFYREHVAALFFMLMLNSVELMLSRPRRAILAVFAGIAAGLLVLIKPEFGSLMLVLSIIWLVKAWREKNIRDHLVPWLICGATALLVTFPAVIADRLVFREWFFINTHQGYHYSLSYCGDLDGPKTENRNLSFSEKDSARYSRMNPLANKVFFSSDPSIPYSRRDHYLMGKAWQCIEENPRQSAYMLMQRGLITLFLLDATAASWVESEDFGKYWPAAVIQGLRGLNWLIEISMIIFLLPGVIMLRKSESGRLCIISIIWYVLFYATAFYQVRFRISVWPAFLLLSAAGFSKFPEQSRPRNKIPALFFIYAVCCLIAIGFVSRPWRSSIWQAGNWNKVVIGPGLSDEHKRWVLLELGNIYIRADRMDLLERELGDFSRNYRETLTTEILSETAAGLEESRHPGAALFFHRLAQELFGSAEAAGQIKRITAMHRSFVIDSWKLAARDRSFAIYTAELPQPVPGSPDTPPRDLNLKGAGVVFKLNPALNKGSQARAGQYFFQAERVWITLAPDGRPPDRDSPLILEFYADSADAP